MGPSLRTGLCLPNRPSSARAWAWAKTLNTQAQPHNCT